MPRKSASSLKPIPAFKSEADESAFWKKHDAMDYLDLSKAERVTLPNLKPGADTILLGLPAHMEDVSGVAVARVGGVDKPS